jgi:hypothetical protein
MRSVQTRRCEANAPQFIPPLNTLSLFPTCRPVDAPDEKRTNGDESYREACLLVREVEDGSGVGSEDIKIGFVDCLWVDCIYRD